MINPNQKSLMKKFLLLCIFLLPSLNGSAQTWQPSPGHTQIPIWPTRKIPDAIKNPPAESVVTSAHLVAGKKWLWIPNVSNPTMTLYFPKKNNTGAAIVVFPGGGFKGLAIDLEGTEICHWVTSIGATCVLLKYRVPDSGPAWHKSCHCHIYPKTPTALQDAQRTIGLVRLNSKKWHVNPNKIGVIGFSAGGYMVADISTHFQHRAYKPIDAADQQSCRPDFAMAIYPGHMRQNKKFTLNHHLHFTKNTPPTFIVQAENDPEDNIDNSLLYYISLKNAGAPVEMHLYAQGGHAFGLRKTQHLITHWPKLADKWLNSIGII